VSRRSRICECGTPKQVGDEACARCLALDGGSEAERVIVNALRALGGSATTEAVMLEAGISYRQARRAASKLEKSGRVLRVEDQMNVRSKNMPTLHLSDITPPSVEWLQLAIPTFDAYLVEAGAAESEAIVKGKRGSSTRARRAHIMEIQLELRLSRRRRRGGAA
jgi:hypothetical protein